MSIAEDLNNMELHRSVKIDTPNTKLIKNETLRGNDEYSYAKHFEGSLSVQEIKKLPLELKVCYMIQSWEKHMVPGGISEWAELIGWKRFQPNNLVYTEETYRDWKEQAEMEAQRMLAFISQFIITPMSMRDFEKMIDMDKNETEYIQAIHRRGLFK